MSFAWLVEAGLKPVRIAFHLLIIPIYFNLAQFPLRSLCCVSFQDVEFFHSAQASLVLSRSTLFFHFTHSLKIHVKPSAAAPNNIHVPSFH